MVALVVQVVWVSLVLLAGQVLLVVQALWVGMVLLAVLVLVEPLAGTAFVGSQ